MGILFDHALQIKNYIFIMYYLIRMHNNNFCDLVKNIMIFKINHLRIIFYEILSLEDKLFFQKFFFLRKMFKKLLM